MPARAAPLPSRPPEVELAPAAAAARRHDPVRPTLAEWHAAGPWWIGCGCGGCGRLVYRPLGLLIEEHGGGHFPRALAARMRCGCGRRPDTWLNPNPALGASGRGDAGGPIRVPLVCARLWRRGGGQPRPRARALHTRPRPPDPGAVDDAPRPSPRLPPAPALSAQERGFLRAGLTPVFGTAPRAADGILVRTRPAGPGGRREPKLGPAARSLIERGLLRLGGEGPFPRLLFTEAGMAALRAMVADRRLTDPERFAHLRRELGIG